MKDAFVHVHSMRLASGEEVLVARALAESGALGYGFSFRLESTEARHMAEWNAGVRAERPAYQPVLGHPWETAYLNKLQIDWGSEPGFAAIRWLSTA